MTTLQDWLTNAGEGPLAVPDDTKDQLGRFIRDLGGVIVAGSNTPSVQMVHRYLDQVAGAGSVPVLGTGRQVDPVNAAFANSTAAQALDFDDIAPSCVSHLGAVIVPAVLSVIDQCDSQRALDGVILGLAVVDRLAEAFTHEVYDRGLQPTHTMGSIAATIALLHALDADETTRSSALGLLATNTPGLRAHTGTAYKPAQAGMVSAAAVRSVLLAREGMTSGADAIDVVMRLLGISDDQLRHLTRNGELSPVPLAAKAFPTCGASHTSIEATQNVRKALGINGDAPLDVDITVTVPPRVMDALAFDRPQTADEARFSMPYPIAAAWVTGAVDPSDFGEVALRRAEVADVMERVTVVTDDDLTPPPTWSGFPAIVTATVGSRSETARVERPLGYPERPLSDAQWRAKFMTCVAPAYGSARATTAFETLSGPDVLTHMGRVLGAP